MELLSRVRKIVIFSDKVIEKLKGIGAEGIILGCTEIGMLVSAESTISRMYDTTKIHAEQAVNFALE